VNPEYLTADRTVLHTAHGAYVWDETAGRYLPAPELELPPIYDPESLN
jgi:hypothetical protein